MRDAASIRQMVWYRQLIPRFRIFAVYKGVSLIGFMAVFFAAYFLLLNFPAYPVRLMPATAMDRLIGFHPFTLALYLSLWVYVSLAPSWIIDRIELSAYFRACCGLGITGCAIFYFWPTASPAPDVDWGQYPSFGFLKSVDDSGNACPSLHAAFAVFSGTWAHVMLRRMRSPLWALGLNGCWCAGIVYSTLSTKQHVALDAIAGTALGLVWFWVHRRLILPLARNRQGLPLSARTGARRNADAGRL